MCGAQVFRHVQGWHRLAIGSQSRAGRLRQRCRCAHAIRASTPHAQGLGRLRPALPRPPFEPASCITGACADSRPTLDRPPFEPASCTAGAGVTFKTSAACGAIPAPIASAVSSATSARRTVIVFMAMYPSSSGPPGHCRRYVPAGGVPPPTRRTAGGGVPRLIHALHHPAPAADRYADATRAVHGRHRPGVRSRHGQRRGGLEQPCPPRRWAPAPAAAPRHRAERGPAGRARRLRGPAVPPPMAWLPGDARGQATETLLRVPRSSHGLTAPPAEQTERRAAQS